jgi:hypothetical protein
MCLAELPARAFWPAMTLFPATVKRMMSLKAHQTALIPLARSALRGMGASIFLALDGTKPDVPLTLPCPGGLRPRQSQSIQGRKQMA